MLGVCHILKKSREKREDEAYAYGVEADCGEDNDKGSVHSEAPKEAAGRTRTPPKVSSMAVGSPTGPAPTTTAVFSMHKVLF